MKKRDDHEEKCTVYQCRTVGCDFTGRDKQDRDKHEGICTLTLECKCGRSFTNATKTNMGWEIPKGTAKRRKYTARSEFKAHQRICKVIEEERRAQRTEWWKEIPTPEAWDETKERSDEGNMSGMEESSEWPTDESGEDL